MKLIEFRLSVILVLSFILFLPMADANSSAAFGAAQNRQKQTRKKRKTVKRTYYSRLIRGPRGGCYYINRNGKKTYVPRNLCR